MMQTCFFVGTANPRVQTSFSLVIVSALACKTPDPFAFMFRCLPMLSDMDASPNFGGKHRHNYRSN